MGLLLSSSIIFLLCHHCVNGFSVVSLNGLLPPRANTLLLAANAEILPRSGSRSDDHEDNTTNQIIATEAKARLLRSGQAQNRLFRATKREDRISFLEEKLLSATTADDVDGTTAAEALTEAEHKELAGLRQTRESFEEQYDPASFTEEHVDFKSMHNDAFVALCRYCERERNAGNGGDGNDGPSGAADASPVNVFYLDGPDGGTTSALVDAGFSTSQLFVANRHTASCQALRSILPDEHVVCATATEALTMPSSSVDSDNDSNGSDDGGSFRNVDFAAYYFDGCGRFVPHLVGMMSAALMRDNDNDDDDERKRQQLCFPVAVGFSLLGGGKDIIDKELSICRSLSAMARLRGCRLVHVLDDPARYGIRSDVRKIGGENDGTMTSWMLLEADNTL